jgi:dTDP-4-amino-4,6-dideoxygalactose transaminase
MSAVGSPGDIPFNRPFATGREFAYIRQAIENRHLSGDGPFTRRCHEWLEHRLGCTRALLTHSCTAALEMMALLAEIQPGDEVIMPSFTFVSTANAFVLRGGVPVFVDIRPDTFNLDERRLAEAITARTRAIVAVHYAGVACEMDEMVAVARRHGLLLLEDAAQAFQAFYRDRPLGTFGELAALSFHETKNVIAGEGGALLVNDPRWTERAEVIREKGTNRSRFFRGEIDKYTWVDVGSSYLPSEITAAFLWAQIEDADAITAERLRIWHALHAACEPLEHKGLVRRPLVPEHCRHNGHMYPVLLADAGRRAAVLTALNRHGINAVFHYVPLHSSPAGRRFGRVAGDLPHSDDVSARLIRLPLWMGMTETAVEQITEALLRVLMA